MSSNTQINSRRFRVWCEDCGADVAIVLGWMTKADLDRGINPKVTEHKKKTRHKDIRIGVLDE
jgi:hypothetical protein